MKWNISIILIEMKHSEKPGWKNAVVHVDPQGRADDEVQGESDPHQVARFVFRQVVGWHVHHAPDSQQKWVLGQIVWQLLNKIVGHVLGQMVPMLLGQIKMASLLCEICPFVVVCLEDYEILSIFHWKIAQNRKTSKKLLKIRPALQCFPLIIG